MGTEHPYAPHHPILTPRNQTVTALVVIGWVTCTVLLALVVARRVQMATDARATAAMALAYDALPLLLGLAWVVLAAALLGRQWTLAGVAACVCAEHLLLVVPRTMADRTPHWVRDAPRLTMVVANVFVDNATPDDAARQLVQCDADVIVIVEATRHFMARFDRLGGDTAFPHRVDDPDDDSDYAVAIAGRRPFGARSDVRDVGPLRLAVAEVDVHGVPTLVAALNPMAAVDPGGFDTWKEQIQALASVVPQLPGPLVVAGDLNTTRFRPEFQTLLRGRLTDAIDALGKGLSPSFKLSAEGPLSSVGAVARLDHALVDELVHPLAMEQLQPCGSDHLPFRLSLAVRRSAPRHHWR